MRYLLNRFLLNIFVTLLLLTGQTMAQVRDTKGLKPEKRYKMASHMIKEGSYYNAASELQVLAKETEGNKKYREKLAEAYFLARDYKSAETIYALLAQQDVKHQTIAGFRYAECLKYNAKYEEAQAAFEAYAKESKHKDEKEKPYKAYALQEIKSCKYALLNNHVSKAVNVEHLGNEINSAYSDFAPGFWGDKLIFSSHQEDSVILVHNTLPHSNYVRLYASTSDGISWSRPEELPDVLNHDYMNTTNAAFSTDQQRLYFTRCYPEKQGMHCDIYMSRLEEGRFTKPLKLEKINEAGHTTTQPQIAKVKLGKAEKEVLFFTSNRKGGVGGMDIWYSPLDKDGLPAAPLNPGRKVNSVRDEITPLYDSHTQSLYFSSNFHEGFGGFDVFRATGELKNLSSPYNLGQPINSSLDDTYYRFVAGNDETGFLVSNRPGGYHLTSETCCDDIYSFAPGSVPADTLVEVPVEVVAIPDTTTEREEVFTCTKLGHDIKIKDRKGLKVILNYGYNDTDFIDQHAADLDCMVELLKEYNDVRVKVVTHTDNVGSEHYNLKLSKQRAHSIQHYLSGHGIPGNRVQMEWLGESKPIAANENPDGSDNEDNRALNRRAEIIILN